MSSDIFQQIQEKFRDLDKIFEATDRLNDVIANPNATQEQVEEALKKGFDTLEEVENRRKSQ